MKHLFLFLLFASSAFQVFSQKQIHPCSAVKSKNTEAKSASLTPAEIRKTEKYDVHFYKLDLNITNTTTTLSGTVEMHAKSRVSLDTIWYELFPTLTISAVQLNGMAVPFVRKGSAIKVAANLAAQQPFVVTTTYSGTPPTANTNPLGGSGLSNRTSPSWGNQVTWSLSQPFSAYEWWPCKQSLADKADSVDVSITVPSTCKAGSNGVLKNVETLPNNKARYEWKHRHPIDYYLISVSVGQYVDFRVWAHPANSPDSVLIQNYVYDNPATLTNFQADIEETAAFLEYFSTVFGPYPFADEKYGHSMAPIGGGMEHQTMTTQGSFSQSLTAHELAHQWFGDHVTCRSWADIWVNEGFASYSEYLMLAQLYPGEEVTQMQGVHTSVMDQLGGSVWVEDSLNNSRIFSSRLTYDKGSALIHTLRFTINNDSVFFRSLRKYQTRFADSTALGTDMQMVMEEESGLNLAPIFEQWYFGEGYPTYSVRWNTSLGNLHLKISHSCTMPSVTPKFTNALEVKFKRSGQSDTTIRFEIGSNNDLFLVPGLGNVTGITAVDPKNWVVNKLGNTTKDPTLVVTGAAETVTIEDDMEIAPNPVQNQLKINTKRSGLQHLNVLDPQGRLVLKQDFVSHLDLDMSSYPAGIYLFQLSEKNGPGKTYRLVRR